MNSVRKMVVGLMFLSLILPGVAVSAPLPILDLSPYKGKVVYLDFWASWWAPCRISFPWMSQNQTAYERQGLVIIAVNVDHDRRLADDFMNRNPSQFKVVYDPAGALASAYNIKAMPTSVLIDRNGMIRYVHSGFLENQENTYRSHIAELLNEKAP